MGWSGGSEVARPLIVAAKKYVPESCRAFFYKVLIDTLEHEDWDTRDEATGIDPIFDKVLNKMYPDE